MTEKKLLSVFSVLCLFLIVPFSLIADTKTDQEKALEADLRQAEIEKQAGEILLDTTKTQTKTIESEITRLANEIKKSNNIIEEKNDNIKTLSSEVDDRELKIKLLNEKIETAKASVAKIMVNMNELDNLSFVEIMLSSKNLSEALIDSDIFSSINESMSTIVLDIRELEAQNRTEKEQLKQKQNAELDAKKEIELEKARVQKNEAEQQTLLTGSKQQEATLYLYVAGKEQEMERIRTALFALRDTDGIQFGDAVEYAKSVQKITGVRPAFLLAILQQESNIGQNVGQCLITDLTTGDGKGKNTGTFFEKVMGPASLEHFPRLMKDLGRDWKTTPVSCPIDIQGRGTATKYYQGRGYGGAMGPAQFIPSTWVLFEERVKTATRQKTADPWRAIDAFMASGMYLADLGASKGTYSAEVAAACKYYGSGGSSCTYGTQVLARVNNLQIMIDTLEGK